MPGQPRRWPGDAYRTFRFAFYAHDGQPTRESRQGWPSTFDRRRAYDRVWCVECGQPIEPGEVHLVNRNANLYRLHFDLRHRRAAAAGRDEGAAALIEHDDLWPRDERHRYRIYAVVGDDREVLATSPTAAGVGLALVTLHEDQKQIGRRLADRGRIGVLDTCPDGKRSPDGEWIVQPWDRRPA